MPLYLYKLGMCIGHNLFPEYCHGAYYRSVPELWKFACRSNARLIQNGVDGKTVRLTAIIITGHDKVYTNGRSLGFRNSTCWNCTFLTFFSQALFISFLACVPMIQGSTIDDSPIWANDFYWRSVLTAWRDSHTNGLGTAGL